MQRLCEKCGAELIPGQNWYTNKGDHICCDCSSYPHYYAPPQTEELPSPLYDANDYEEAILARQEIGYDD